MRKLLLSFCFVAAFASHALADWTGKDASSSTITFKNASGACTSVVCVPQAAISDSTGANIVAVKAASTAAAAGDISLVVNQSPNSQMAVAIGATGDAANAATVVGQLKQIQANTAGPLPPQSVGVPVGGIGLCDGGNGSTNPCTTIATVKAASTPAVATDKALVVDQRPGTVLSVGQIYPAGSTPITISATGTVSATTATLAANASLHTYICGFSIRANATAAATGNATVTGPVTGTLNFTQWTAPLASGLGVTEEVFSPCIISSAINTGIAVISAAPGTGGTVSVTAWGYQL